MVAPEPAGNPRRRFGSSSPRRSQVRIVQMLFRVCLLAVGLLACATTAGCGGCGDSGGFDARAPDIAIAGGTFSLSWSLFDDTKNRPVNCEKVDPNATVFVQ